MVDELFKMAPMVPNVEPSEYDRSLVDYASTMASIALERINDPNLMIMDNPPLLLTNSLWTIGLGGCGFYVFGNIRDGEISLSAAHLSPPGFRVCVSRLGYGTVVLFALVSGSVSGSGAACDAQADLAACVWTYYGSIKKAEIRLSDSGLELRIEQQQWEPIVAGVSRQLKDQAVLIRYKASPLHALPGTELKYKYTPISKIISDPYLPALQVYKQIKPFGRHDLRLFRSIVRALGLSISDKEIARVQRIFVGLNLLD